VERVVVADVGAVDGSQAVQSVVGDLQDPAAVDEAVGRSQVTVRHELRVV